MRLTATLIVLALCLVGTIAGPTSRAADMGPRGLAAGLAVGDTAPDWTLTDADGRAHTLSGYGGKIVVLDFWASWCGPCAKVMPRMEKLHQKYKDRGVVVLGVNSWETGDPVALMRKKRLTYGLLLKGEDVAAAYGVKSLPVVCVVGADGRVIYYHAGGDDKNLSALIEKHLKESGP